MAGAMMDSRGPSRGGGGGNDNNEKEDYEEYMRRINKRGEFKGLAWIVLAHAPTTDACIYIYVTARSIHLHSFLIHSQPGQLHHQPKLRNETGCHDMFWELRWMGSKRWWHHAQA